MQFKRSNLIRTTGVLACLLLVSGTPFAGGTGSVQAQTRTQGESVRIRTARFWRTNGAKTLIEGIIGMPLGAAAGSPNAEVSLEVRDMNGGVLHREAWTDTLSERLAAVARARPGAETTSPVSFVVPQGNYAITVAVKRGAQVDSARTEVVSFAAQPLISDVLVSARVRALAEGEEPTGAETRKGRYAIERATQPKVLPTEPKLWWYIELYPVGTAPVTEELEFAVLRASGGDPLVRTQRSITVGERGGIDIAALVVQGLPPGDYKLRVTARANGREEQREASFAMGSLDDVPVVAAAATTGSEAALFDRYFTATVRTDAEIASLVETLTLVSPGESVPSATKQLAPDAQRRFLARYWSRTTDPNPATDVHEMFEEYAARAAHVARAFVEKDIGRSGARTDRGRIYMKYGAPDARQSLDLTGGRGGVEVWKYSRSRNLKFAFLDETSFQNYNLVYTTDPNELTLADWQERVRDPETIRQIMNF